MSHPYHLQETTLSDIIQRSFRLINADLDVLEALSLFRREHLTQAIIWENNQCFGVITKPDLLDGIYQADIPVETMLDHAVGRVDGILRSRAIVLPHSRIATLEDLWRYRFPAHQPCDIDQAAIALSPSNLNGDDTPDILLNAGDLSQDNHYVILVNAEHQPCGLVGPDGWRWLDQWKIAQLTKACQAAQGEVCQHQQRTDRYQPGIDQQNAFVDLLVKIARSLQISSSLATTLQLGVQEICDLLGGDRAIVHQFKTDSDNQELSVALAVSMPRWAVDIATLDDAFFAPDYWPSIWVIDDVQNADLDPSMRQLLTQIDVQSMLAVMLMVADQPWGVLAVHRCAKADPWLETHRRWLDRLSPILSLAIEQTSLFDQLEIELQERWRVEGKMQSLSEQLELRMAERAKEQSEANLALERQIQEHQLLIEKWRTSETEVRAFFEAMTEVVLMVDAQLNVVRIAPTSPQFLYGPETDIFTKTVEMFCDLDQMLPYGEIIQQAIETKVGTSIKYQLEVDGQPRWFYARISPVPDRDCIAWVAQDITALEQSETARIETETRLGLLLDGVSEYGIFELNLDGTIASWNTGAEHIHGYTEAEVIGQPYDILFSASALETNGPQKELDAARLQGRYEGEGVRKHQSGRSIWADVTISALRDRGESIRGFAVVVCDTTEERRAKMWQKLLERAINASASGVIITDATNSNNPIVYVNSGFEAITGYSEYEAIGRNCRFLQGVDHDQPGLHTLRQAIAQQQDCRVTLRNYRNDGSMFWNELTISPIHNESGMVTHYIGIQTDITTSHESKIELATLGAKLQAVFDSACDVAIVSTASDGTIQLANVGARKLLGCPGDIDLQQFSLDQFFLSTEMQQRHAQLEVARSRTGSPPSSFDCLALCCTQQRSEPYEWTLQRYDGTTLCVSLDIAPIYSDDQHILGFVAIAQDITERSRMQTELQQSKMLLDGVLNSSIDGIIAFQSVRDPNTQRIIDFQWLVSNEAVSRLTPRFQQGQVGQYLLQTMPEHETNGLFAAYVAVVEKGDLFETQICYDDTDPPVWLQLTAVPLGDGLAVTFRNITKNKQIETMLKEANDELQQKITVLDSRNQDMLKLGQINEYLQASKTVHDAYNVVAAIMPDLFHDCSGGVYEIEENDQRAERLTCVTSWGTQPPVSALTFDRHDCWALRRSHGHFVDRQKQSLFCQHLTTQEAIGVSLCLPLSAQGKSLGLLHLWSPDPEALTKDKRRIAHTVAEHLALSVTNILLRASLELQSTRDPLTGLFNRRYMEETLERLICRSQAQAGCLGIIMIDIDRFKSFNDRYGHAIGDLVLREVAQLLPKALRQSDIACRYGGEELMAILPDASAVVVYQRAEQLRSQIEALKLSHDGRAIDQVTASFGVAVFPECGRDRRDLLRVADDALYRAKHEGRNCVRLAEALVETIIASDPSYPRSSHPGTPSPS
jgi:diguanylate cyclase (GGDEF)-like protein/PAS domain S-box-containing protein